MATLRRSPIMQRAITHLATLYGFDLMKGDGSSIKLHNAPYMELNIVAYAPGIVAVNHARHDPYWHETSYDPEMTFWVNDKGWHAATYEQTGTIYQELITFEGGKPVRFMKPTQRYRVC